MKELDEKERQLLNLLQEGTLCVPRITRLAHKLQIPTTTLHSKLKKLENDGVIKGYKAELDGKKIGKSMIVFAVIKVNYEKVYHNKDAMEDFGMRLAKIPEILEVHSCSGDWDYLIKVKIKDADEYAKVAQNKILPLGGIQKLESYVSYVTFKETSEIKL
ncbi:putative HTH-type transcriptional regulator [uncultured archaeon]|nr:putative HTH-type transcriptional regulator [uncultured archaeon]